MVAITNVLSYGIGNDQIQFVLKLFFGNHPIELLTKIVKTLFVVHDLCAHNLS